LLSGTILKNSSKDLICSNKDVDDLKTYLASDLNYYFCDITKQRISRRLASTKSEYDNLKRQQEQEIAQILEKEKYPHKTLSSSANKQLKANLKFLNSKLVISRFTTMLIFFRIRASEQPHLLCEVIRPKLEEAYLINLSRSGYHKVLTYMVLEKYTDLKLKLYEEFVRQKLSASNLRRNPSVSQLNGIKSGPGMDRAHKLSLHLAVHLWKQVYGHDLAYAKVRTQVRQALALPSNIYVTCHHTNRVLHVKYDKEIIDALQESRTKTPNLTPGAKMRLKQVIDVLKMLKEDSAVMNDFAKRSILVLKELK